MRRLSLVLFLLVSLLVSGCLEDLPSPAHIDKLRVLAIEADPPEVGAGDTLTLRALAVHPDFPANAIELKWRACLIPERSAGFAGSGGNSASGGGSYSLNDPGTCFDVAPGTEGTVELGTGTEVTLTIPADFLEDTEALAALIGLPASSAELVALAAPFILQIAGVNVTVALEATLPDGTKLTAFKRVNVSTATTPNVNPENVAFHFKLESDAAIEVPQEGSPPSDRKCFVGEDTQPISIKPGRYLMSALNIPDPHVQYEVLIGAAGPSITVEADEQCTIPIPGCEVHEEVYFYSFFSTAGTFGQNIIKSRGSHDNVWDLSTEDLEGKDSVDVWIVTRDGRGGSTFCASNLLVTAD